MKEKLLLLQTLEEIEIATSLLKADDSDSSNAIDQSYKKLKTTITPLDKDSELYQRLEKYAIGSQDTDYFSTLRIEVLDIFEIQRYLY